MRLLQRPSLPRKFGLESTVAVAVAVAATMIWNVELLRPQNLGVTARRVRVEATVQMATVNLAGGRVESLGQVDRITTTADCLQRREACTPAFAVCVARRGIRG